MTSRSKRGHGQEEGISHYKVHDRESTSNDRQSENDFLINMYDPGF